MRPINSLRRGVASGPLVDEDHERVLTIGGIPGSPTTNLGQILELSGLIAAGWARGRLIGSCCARIEFFGIV